MEKSMSVHTSRHRRVMLATHTVAKDPTLFSYLRMKNTRAVYRVINCTLADFRPLLVNSSIPRDLYGLEL
jgi:hypothetical protein